MARFLRPATAAVVVAFITTACDEAPPPPAPEVVRPAKLVTVGSASQRQDVSFPAVIRAARSAELTFPVAGEVVELNALEGAEISAGAVIARLDQRDAKNALAQAEAEYENALSEFRRAERLRERDAISQSALESRQTQLEVREATVATARKALDDTVIRAPFTGSVSRVLVEQFQNVQAKEAIAIVQGGDTEAIIDIPGSLLARVPQLTPVGTRVILDAAPDIDIPATFREASGQADASTQTYQISFTFEPPENLLILPGMTATVRSTFVFNDEQAQGPAGVSVPLGAILAEGAQRYVWVVNEQMQLRKRAVSVGSDVAAGATVTAGLEVGETIVAAGVSFLAEGMTVREWVPE